MVNKQLVVNVTYRNARMDPVCKETYTLQEYTEMMKTDLLRLVTDVEELCYIANNNKSKEEWSDETWSMFGKIKHKLLDKAGDIGRLPQNLSERTSVPLTEYVAEVIGEEG